MKRFVAAAPAAVLALFAILSTASADGPKLPLGRELSPAACGSGTPVVDVRQHVLNDADSGVGSNSWALDRYERRIRVWETAPNTFCAITRYDGEFTTLAGVSPNGTGTVGAGVTGELKGGYRTTQFTATFAPQKPTHGDIGTFDYQCNVDPACPGRVSWVTFYFTGASFDFSWWGWEYQTECNGSWINAISGNSGDILGIVRQCGEHDGQESGNH